MKKKIIIWSLFVFFILIMTPSISAVEFDAAMGENKQRFINDIRKIDMSEFKERIQKIGIHKLRKEIRNINVKSSFEKWEEKLGNNPAQPQCIITFMALLIIINLFGKIVGLIFSIIAPLLDILIVILSRIANLIIAIITPIIKITIAGLIAYFSIAAIIDLFFLSIFLLLILLRGGS